MKKIVTENSRNFAYFFAIFFYEVINLNRTSVPSAAAYRYAWESYANDVVSEIHNMSPEEHKRSVNQLLLDCAAKNVPWEEFKSILEYPGGMTEKELGLRALLQSYFDPLSINVLQSHFSHFYQERRNITKLAAEALHDNYENKELNSKWKANRLIIDEIGKSLLRQNIQPEIPPDHMSETSSF